MAWLDEQLTEQFYAWELRGRGWQIYDSPVVVEPPFRSFYGHFVPSPQAVDDGRKPTAISSFFERFRKKLAPERKQAAEECPPEEEPEPTWFVRDSLQEIAITLPSNLQTPRDTFEQFLFNLSNCRESVAFELLGTSEAVTPLFAAHPSDSKLIHRQLGAHFPEVVLTPCENKLADAWTESAETAIIEFGLEDEFMLPLAVGKIDGFIGITSVLSELEQGETGLFQILFQPVRAPWGESMLRAVTDNEGDAFFFNRPEILPATKQKLSRPLFAAVIRLAAKSDDLERAWQIIRDMAGATASRQPVDGKKRSNQKTNGARWNVLPSSARNCLTGLQQSSKNRPSPSANPARSRCISSRDCSSAAAAERCMSTPGAQTTRAPSVKTKSARRCLRRFLSAALEKTSPIPSKSPLTLNAPKQRLPNVTKVQKPSVLSAKTCGRK